MQNSGRLKGVSHIVLKDPLSPLSLPSSSYVVKKDVGQSEKDACAVACVGVAAACAAVVHAVEHLKSVADKAVSGLARHLRHKADATGIALLLWIVQTNARRCVYRRCHGYHTGKADKGDGKTEAQRERERKTADSGEKRAGR